MKLLSWNIQWGKGLDGCVDLPRIFQTIQRQGDFDIICLQEVAVNFVDLPGSRGENQFDRLSSALTGFNGIWGVATDIPDKCGGRNLFGNAIFSRFPVGQIWRHLLPWQAELMTPSMQRVLIEAVIYTNLGAARVMTTHLEYYSQHQRETQINAIRDLHRNACAMSRRESLKEEEGGPFEVFSRPEQALLCGDLNFPAWALEREQILAPFEDAVPNFFDAWSTLHPDTQHSPTVGIHSGDFVDRPECFDYIFVTDGLIPRLRTYGIDMMTQASDHQPIWVEFE
ncbi:MAG: endonuclease/exonuclease/phosphatase family protein [Nitrosomonas sp.]|nr:endonuclease/exonuclease/phosphatase family protein [Nitrosomonas sp.]